MLMRLLHEVGCTLSTNAMHGTTGISVNPATIRLGFPLESKSLRVMNVTQLKIVIIFEPITSCPCSTKVVALFFITECMDFRDEMLKASKDVHELNVNVVMKG
jgi:hypothetical protein